MAEPTEQQIENARNAGWDPGTPGDPSYPREPPYGWDVHGTPPEIDSELGHNGVPAPVEGEQ
jgi:hypothetical protein